nr:GTP 3',8-cyclase MoaA [Dongshaea marina]
MEPLADSFSRKFSYLRLSLTDVCNFRCRYCLPDGYQSSGRQHFLQRHEVGHLLSAFSVLGTRKVRLTGGEPSLRRDLTSIIETTAATPGIESVAITTNGYRLQKLAAQWQQAGLNAVNVSLDSLDPRMFHAITGDSRFALVMDGIEEALSLGYQAVKVNAVLLKGLNDVQLDSYLEWIRSRPIQLRFIELMETGEMSELFDKHHVSGTVIERQLLSNGWQLKPRGKHAGPAQVYSHPDYLGEIGLIMPYAKDFCQSCNRLRVSAVGALHLCLFGDEGIGIRDYLQSADDQEALIGYLRESLSQKKLSHQLGEGNTGVTPNLAFLGG